MTNIATKIAHLNHMKAQSAETNLTKLANDQEKKLNDKSKLRRLQEIVDSVKSDGVITADENRFLAKALAAHGMDSVAFTKWTEDDSTVVLLNADEDRDIDETQALGNKKALDGAVDTIKGRIEAVDDSEGALNFKIQLGMSELTASEQGRAGVMKRFEDHRREMQQKWTG